MTKRRQRRFEKSIQAARARYALNQPWPGTVELEERPGRRLLKRLTRRVARQ